MLIVQCEQPGLLYVNGWFCGELTEPLMLPVRPDGRVYLEFRALVGHVFPLAASLTFAQGVLVPPFPASVYAVQWPDRVTELELRPTPIPEAGAPREPLSSLTLGKIRLFHQRLGDGEVLCTRAEPLFSMPSGTRGLRAMQLPEEGGALLLGEHPDGASAWLLDTADPARPTLADSIHARQLALEEEGGALRALSYAEDTVGHAHLTVYRPQDGRLTIVSREHAWMPGAPRWPQTELEILRAYLEALAAGADEEAAAYLTPVAADLLAATPLPSYHAVVELPRPLLAPPTDHPLTLGLLEIRAANLGTVHAVCARALPSAHAQGRFLLESVTPVSSNDSIAGISP